MKSNKTKEYAWGVGIAIIGSFIMTYIACSSCRSNGERYFDYTLFSSIVWTLLWLGNSILNDYLSKKISWIKMPVKRLVVGVVATVMFTVVSVLVIVKSFELILDFQFNNYWSIIESSLLITFFISLFFHGRGFLLSWRHAAVDAEKYQKESITATYESLKSQVNPHFLFNSLNALTQLVYEDRDKAAKFIKQLSDVYRYVLDTREKELATIEDELRFLDSYFYLQKIRFGENLKIYITIKNRQFMIAPLALQMLIENAIKHNEVSEEHALTIRIYEQNESLVIENNRKEKTKLYEGSSGLGIENISRRYKFLSTREIIVKKTKTHFIVELPIIKQIE